MYRSMYLIHWCIKITIHFLIQNLYLSGWLLVLEHIGAIDFIDFIMDSIVAEW